MWRKSSFSSDNPTADCIEVALIGSGALVRDSKHTAPVLRFPTRSWARFMQQHRDPVLPDLPTFSVPAGVPVLTPDMVRHALGG